MSKQGAGKIITRTLEADTLPSASELAMLARLASMPDSDIPPNSPGTEWTRPGAPSPIITFALKPRD
ncbi:hypothetical protein GCM10007901_44940 [Dyella acidisoli]|uniref:Uncharacterized protein n=1 Tax=Dyella acidisoli TaxID=1867834 RepID=A0ABQ5XV76_9GAMM|nr:hypothetical protein GCM10007901_44940 [Dyella acidisoli]